MRLDKYLKVSRLIKRRTVAKEVCEAGRIGVNGRPAKAGHEVKIGDELKISFGSRRLKVRVVELKDTVRTEDAAKMYEVLEDVKVERPPLL